MENQNTTPPAQESPINQTVDSSPEPKKLSLKERIKLKTAKYDEDWRRKNRKKLLLILLLLLLLLLLCCGCCFGTIIFIRDRQAPNSNGEGETTSSQTSTTTSQEASTTSSVEAPSSTSSSVTVTTPIIEGTSIVYHSPVNGSEFDYNRTFWAVSLEGKRVQIPIPDTGVQLIQKRPEKDWAFYVISDIENTDPAKQVTGLKLINLKTREVRAIVEPNLNLNQYQVFAGKVSPDGKYYTYSIGSCQFEMMCTGSSPDEAKAKYGLYLYDIANNKSTKLTSSFGVSQNWSNDSTTLYIASSVPNSSESSPRGYFKISIPDAKKTLLFDQTNNFYDTYFPLANGNFFKLGVDSTNTKVTAMITSLTATVETVDAAFFADYIFVDTSNPKGNIVIYMRKSPLNDVGTKIADIYMYNTTTKANTKLYAGTANASIRGVSQWLDENRFIANMNIDKKDQGLGSDVVIVDIRDGTVKKLTNDTVAFVSQ